MAKRSEYKKLGYTDEQINKAIASTGMGGSPVNVAPANTTKAPQAPTTPVAPIAQMSPDAETPANRAGTVSAPQPAPVSQPAVSQPPVSPDNVTPADAAIASVTQKVQAQPATPTPTPTAQKPVETTAKKETAQLGAEGQVKNYDISTGREEEIQSNLTRISAENPALLTDRAKFDQAFGYATADAGKKALLDSFFDSKSTKMDAGSIFSTLLAGGQIPKSNLGSPEFKSASARLAKLRKYSSYSVTQLVSAIGKELIQGSQEYNDLYSTPGGKLKIDQANKYLETNGVNLSETGTKKTDEILNNSLSVKQAIADGVITNEEWASMMNSTEISAKREEVQKKKDRYDTLKAQYDAVEDEVDSELKGTGATSSYRAALIANRRKGMYKDLTVATSEYNNATGTLSDLLKDQGERVDANMALVKDERQFAQQKELALFQADLAVEQAKKKMLLEQGDINSDDPFVRRQAIINQVESLKKQFPTADIQRSTEQIVSDVEKLIASGVSAGQALSDNFVKPFMSKDAVKNADLKSRYINTSLGLFDTETKQYVTPSDSTGIAQSTVPTGSVRQEGAFDSSKYMETGTGGAYDNYKGLDLDVKTGEPISGFSGEVVESYNDWKNSKERSIRNPGVAQKPSPFGNYVKIKLDDGRVIQISHLDGVNVKRGDKVDFNTILGTGGATGNVIPGKGGDGSHLDIRVDGMNSVQVRDYLKQYGKKPATDYTTAMSEAYSILSASNLPKHIQEGLAQNLNSVKDNPKLAQNVLRQYYLNGLPAEQQNKDSGREVAINALSAIKSKLQEYERKGGKTGLLEGKTVGLQEAFGTTQNPELSELGTEIRTALQTYRSFISGAAFTEAENQDYKSVFPGTDKDFKLNMSKINGLLASYKNTQETNMKPRIGEKAYNAYFNDRYGDIGNVAEYLNSNKGIKDDWEKIKQEKINGALKGFTFTQ